MAERSAMNATTQAATSADATPAAATEVADENPDVLETERATRRALDRVDAIRRDHQLVVTRIRDYITGIIPGDDLRGSDWSQILRYAHGELVAVFESDTGYLEVRWDPEDREYEAAGFSAAEDSAGHDGDWSRETYCPAEAPALGLDPRFVHAQEARSSELGW